MKFHKKRNEKKERCYKIVWSIKVFIILRTFQMDQITIRVSFVMKLLFHSQRFVRHLPLSNSWKMYLHIRQREHFVTLTLEYKNSVGRITTFSLWWCHSNAAAPVPSPSSTLPQKPPTTYSFRPSQQPSQLPGEPYKMNSIIRHWLEFYISRFWKCLIKF